MPYLPDDLISCLRIIINMSNKFRPWYLQITILDYFAHNSIFPNSSILLPDRKKQLNCNFDKSKLQYKQLFYKKETAVN